MHIGHVSDTKLPVATYAQRSSLIWRNLGVHDAQRSVALVAETKVVALLQLDILGRRRCAECDMTLIAPVWSLLLLRDVEVDGVLGECLVLYRRGRLLRHFRMTAHAVPGNEFCCAHALVMAVLARSPIGVADIAVSCAHAGFGFVALYPVGRVRHRRLVA